MGRRPTPSVVELFKTDMDALSSFMGTRSISSTTLSVLFDAMVHAVLRHAADQPMKWEGTGYVRSKQNLAG
jgi:hypothetical protein